MEHRCSNRTSKRSVEFERFAWPRRYHSMAGAVLHSIYSGAWPLFARESRIGARTRQPFCTVRNGNVRCLSMVRRNVDYGRAAVCRRFARIRRVHRPLLRLPVNPGKKFVSSSRCSSFDSVATTIVHSRNVYIYIFFSLSFRSKMTNQFLPALADRKAWQERFIDTLGDIERLSSDFFICHREYTFARRSSTHVFINSSRKFRRYISFPLNPLFSPRCENTYRR